MILTIRLEISDQCLNGIDGTKDAAYDTQQECEGNEGQFVDRTTETEQTQVAKYRQQKDQTAVAKGADQAHKVVKVRDENSENTQDNHCGSTDSGAGQPSADLSKMFIVGTDKVLEFQGERDSVDRNSEDDVNSHDNHGYHLASAVRKSVVNRRNSVATETPVSRNSCQNIQGSAGSQTSSNSPLPLIGLLQCVLDVRISVVTAKRESNGSQGARETSPNDTVVINRNFRMRVAIHRTLNNYNKDGNHCRNSTQCCNDSDFFESSEDNKWNQKEATNNNDPDWLSKSAGLSSKDSVKKTIQSLIKHCKQDNLLYAQEARASYRKQEQDTKQGNQTS